MCASLDQDNVPNFFIDGDSVKVDRVGWKGATDCQFRNRNSRVYFDSKTALGAKPASQYVFRNRNSRVYFGQQNYVGGLSLRANISSHCTSEEIMTMLISDFFWVSGKTRIR